MAPNSKRDKLATGRPADQKPEVLEKTATVDFKTIECRTKQERYLAPSNEASDIAKPTYGLLVIGPHGIRNTHSDFELADQRIKAHALGMSLSDGTTPKCIQKTRKMRTVS